MIQFALRADRKGVDLGAEVSPSASLSMARITAHEAATLLNNLVDNALRYTPMGGRVDVALSTNPGFDGLDLVVRDSGSGIDASEHLRVYDRFFRGAAAHDNPEIQGTGLGLAIVKSIVELCGGTVSLEQGLSNRQGGHGLGVRVTLKRAPTIPVSGLSGAVNPHV